MSAFFLYSQAFRSQVKEDNPDASFGDIVSPSSGGNVCCVHGVKIVCVGNDWRFWPWICWVKVVSAVYRGVCVHCVTARIL